MDMAGDSVLQLHIVAGFGVGEVAAGKNDHEQACLVNIAGDTVAVIDTDTGDVIPAYVFVATLPYSGYSYPWRYRDAPERHFLRRLLQTCSSPAENANQGPAELANLGSIEKAITFFRILYTGKRQQSNERSSMKENKSNGLESIIWCRL